MERTWGGRNVPMRNQTSIEEAGRHPADSLRIQPADAEKCGVVLLDIYGIDPPGHD